MKRALIILILSAFNICVFAQNHRSGELPRFTGGIEWGYSATLFSGFIYNYFSPEGYRIVESVNDLKFYSNGEMYIHFGYNFNTYWNLSIYTGYAGIANLHNAIPVSIRATRFFGEDHMKDRIFVFGDIGSGICLKPDIQEIGTVKIGCGYRLSLSRDTKLDLNMAVRMTHTHPEIIYDGIPIAMKWTNSNNAYLAGMSLSMAVVF